MRRHGLKYQASIGISVLLFLLTYWPVQVFKSAVTECQPIYNSLADLWLQIQLDLT